jgi:hypothetical protein
MLRREINLNSALILTAAFLLFKPFHIGPADFTKNMRLASSPSIQVHIEQLPPDSNNPDSLRLLLSVTNISDRPLALIDPAIRYVLIPDVKSSPFKSAKAVYMGSQVFNCPPVHSLMVKHLESNGTLTAVIDWGKCWSDLPVTDSPYSIRIGYSTKLAASIAKQMRWDVIPWSGSASSNAIEVQSSVARKKPLVPELGAEW